jgi:hypothetical protein
MKLWGKYISWKHKRHIKKFGSKHIGYFNMFDKEWFEKHQSKLTFLLNHWLFKYYFRFSMRIHKSCKFNEYIDKIETHTFRVSLAENKYRSEFYTDNKFSKRMYFAYRPIWWMLHFLDWLIQRTINPEFSFGFDTLTVSPQHGNNLTTCDGYVVRNVPTSQVWVNTEIWVFSCPLARTYDGGETFEFYGDEGYGRDGQRCDVNGNFIAYNTGGVYFIDASWDGRYSQVQKTLSLPYNVYGTTWGDIRNNAGTEADVITEYITAGFQTNTNEWAFPLVLRDIARGYFTYLSRGILTFQTNSITNGYSVDSASLELRSRSNCEKVTYLYAANPQSNNTLINQDYQCMNGVPIGGNPMTRGLETHIFNIFPGNLSVINKEGITRLGLKLQPDGDNLALYNEGHIQSYYSADTGHSDRRPKLIVIYSLATSGNKSQMII